MSGRQLWVRQTTVVSRTSNKTSGSSFNLLLDGEGLLEGVAYSAGRLFQVLRYVTEL